MKAQPSERLLAMNRHYWSSKIAAARCRWSGVRLGFETALEFWKDIIGPPRGWMPIVALKSGDARHAFCPPMTLSLLVVLVIRLGCMSTQLERFRSHRLDPYGHAMFQEPMERSNQLVGICMYTHKPFCAAFCYAYAPCACIFAHLESSKWAHLRHGEPKPLGRRLQLTNKAQARDPAYLQKEAMMFIGWPCPTDCYWSVFFHCSMPI